MKKVINCRKLELKKLLAAAGIALSFLSAIEVTHGMTAFASDSEDYWNSPYETEIEPKSHEFSVPTPIEPDHIEKHNDMEVPEPPQPDFFEDEKGEKPTDRIDHNYEKEQVETTDEIPDSEYYWDPPYEPEVESKSHEIPVPTPIEPDHIEKDNDVVVPEPPQPDFFEDKKGEEPAVRKEYNYKKEQVEPTEESTTKTISEAKTEPVVDNKPVKPNTNKPLVDDALLALGFLLLGLAGFKCVDMMNQKNEDRIQNELETGYDSFDVESVQYEQEPSYYDDLADKPKIFTLFRK